MCGSKAGEACAFGGQSVDVGGLIGLIVVATQIGDLESVGHDQDHVWRGWTQNTYLSRCSPECGTILPFDSREDGIGLGERLAEIIPLFGEVGRPESAVEQLLNASNQRILCRAHVVVGRCVIGSGLGTNDPLRLRDRLVSHCDLLRLVVCSR